jgi:hypothetical protein
VGGGGQNLETSRKQERSGNQQEVGKDSDTNGKRGAL